jgi:hypothetical protein
MLLVGNDWFGLVGKHKSESRGIAVLGLRVVDVGGKNFGERSTPGTTTGKSSRFGRSVEGATLDLILGSLKQRGSGGKVSRQLKGIRGVRRILLANRIGSSRGATTKEFFMT